MSTAEKVIAGTILATLAAAVALAVAYLTRAP